ncbi:unnamed protein product [Symbiodinium sp. CCMP2456]|nr:unnamed protein product [Symbiodinium sp. CCMP2456]
MVVSGRAGSVSQHLACLILLAFSPLAPAQDLSSVCDHEDYPNASCLIWEPAGR